MTAEAQGIAAVPDVAFRTIDGVRIRYAESGGSQETLVLVNPHRKVVQSGIIPYGLDR